MKNTISDFYSDIGFPGTYTVADLRWYGEDIENIYLRTMHKHIAPGCQVLDAGCGTGLTTNFLAMRNPTCHMHGIDFSRSVYYGQKFAHDHWITNTSWEQKDLEDLRSEDQYDVVICQGVLHHIPGYTRALENLKKSLVPGGKLLLGLYHPWGKILKRITNIKYHSEVLFLDQERNPFETTFTPRDISRLMPGWQILEQVPSLKGNIAIPAFFNYQSGGLYMTVLEKPC